MLIVDVFLRSFSKWPNNILFLFFCNLADRRGEVREETGSFDIVGGFGPRRFGVGIADDVGVVGEEGWILTVSFL